MKSLLHNRDIAEIRGRFQMVTETDARRWGVMSAAEMICHVRESYRLAMGQRSGTVQKLQIPPGLMKGLALWFPRQWPRGVETVPELKSGREGCVPGAFATDRDALVAALSAFVEFKNNRNDHPFFGRMRPRDWMRWGYLHADHHLRQFGR